MSENKFKIGDKVRLSYAKISWTVVATSKDALIVTCNERFFDVRHTVEYNTPAYKNFRLMSRFEACVKGLDEFYVKT